MTDQKQDSGNHPFHREGGEIIFDSPQDKEETARQRREEEQHEFARSQVKTNNRIAWFTGFLVFATFCTIGVGIWQAEISQQAARASEIAARAAESAAKTAFDTLNEMRSGTGASDTHTLAEQAKVQAQQTAALAKAAAKQADAANIEADATKDAARTAKVTLNISQRAYLTVDQPHIDFASQIVEFTVINNGHIPSGKAAVVYHEATLNIRDPTKAERVIPTEFHWRQGDVSPVTVGSPFTVVVSIPKVVEGEINSGHQVIYIAGSISYNDGFPDTPLRVWRFCDRTGFNVASRRLEWDACDANEIIPKLMNTENYPQHEQKH